ncbi:unnamed protein product [Cunninghamella echinulata]
MDVIILKLNKTLAEALFEYDQRFLKVIEEITQLFTRKQNGCYGHIHTNKTEIASLLMQSQNLSDQLKPFLYMNENLQVLTEYHDKNSEHEIQYNSEVDELIKSYNELESRYINAKLTIYGNKEYSNVIEKSIKKMNGLPQITSILNSTIKTYGDEIYQLLQDKSTILSKIKSINDEFAYIKIKFLLMKNEQDMKQRLFKDYIDNMEDVIESLLRQRIIQQLLLDSYEVERKLYIDYKTNLQICINDIEYEEKNKSIPPLKKNKDHDTSKNDIDTTILQINKPSKSNVQLDSILITIADMMDYERKWKKQWSDDINATLEAVHILEQSKANLSQTLYGESISFTDQLNIKPKLYNELQIVFERRIEDFTEALDNLTLEHKKTETLYKERCQLANLFFTNPFKYESKMEDYLDSINNNK